MMKSQINILRQLQELVLTRDEHNQTGDGSHLDQLNQSIEALQKQLDPQLSAIYNRLYKRSHVVISAMTNNCCAGCGMQVPIAQVQQVRIGEHIIACSNCGRILFANSASAAHNVTKQSKDEDIKVGISRFSAEELMVVDLDAKDAAGAITILAEAMEKHNFIANSASLVSSAMEREGVLSTAMEGALAFPHVRGVEGGALTMAIGVSKEGIDWDGTNKVNIVFLSAIPVAVSAFYLRLMSGIVQTFSKAANRKAAIEAKTAAALWKVVCKATRTTVK